MADTPPTHEPGNGNRQPEFDSQATENTQNRVGSTYSLSKQSSALPFQDLSNDVAHWKKLVACQVACPVHTDACGYVTAIERGEYAAAYDIARANNPFVSVCGRVCGAPCEAACRRGMIDHPVAIRALKRFVTEQHGVEAGSFAVDPIEPSRQRVAIIGAGVAGLAAADDLSEMGYAVTVFEAREKAGGMMTYGVPVFRMNRELVDAEIGAILAKGVKLETNARLGRDFSIQDLRDRGFRSILLAIGLEKGRRIDVPGSELEGVTEALTFLRRFNEGQPPAVGDRVIVLGGGNVALDVARSARRLGNPEVMVVCLESRKQMPAAADEVREALEEGIDFYNGWGPISITRNGSELLLEARRCTSVFDETGRFAPQYVETDVARFSADSIVFAVGQASDTSFVGSEDIAVDRGLIQVHAETGKTGAPDVFAAGDISLGPRLFIDAIAAGQRAAQGIHNYLNESAPATEGRAHWRRSTFRMNQALGTPYLGPPVEEGEARVGSLAPYETNYAEAEARRQAARCLHCNINTVFETNICIGCDGCVKICPEHLIQIVPKTLAWHGDAVGIIPQFVEDGEDWVMLKNESTCVRCGLCADVCPTRAVTMCEFSVV